MTSSLPAHVDSLREALDGRSVALVHEWLSGIAGSEQTFMAMAKLLPDADLFALSYNENNGLDFNDRPVSTSLLNNAARGGGRAALLPFMPAAMKRLGRGQEYDVVVSSSHAFSRAFAHEREQRTTHLSYTYTPIRYVWYPDLERHRSKLRIPRTALKPFQRADLQYARGVDSFASISNEIRDRVRDVYGHDSRVVYPPCDTDYFSKSSPPPMGRRGAIVAGRLVPYKRVDLAIHACALAGVALTVVGTGPDEARLRKLAREVHPGGVVFRGSVTRPELRAALGRAAVLIFPGREDFGIVPVEAQAAGTPVVAFGAAGALETVLRHPSAHVEEQDSASFASAILDMLADPPSEEDCRNQAEQFSHRCFERNFASWVVDSLTAQRHSIE